MFTTAATELMQRATILLVSTGESDTFMTMRRTSFVVGGSIWCLVTLGFAGCAQTGLDPEVLGVAEDMDAAKPKPDGGQREAGPGQDSAIGDAAKVDGALAADATLDGSPNSSPDAAVGDAAVGSGGVPICNCPLLTTVKCDGLTFLTTSVAACSNCAAGSCCHRSSTNGNLYCLDPSAI
jgi:hypothetical protein